MRIVCPACNAQYEIVEDLLPEEGREVQCSACGTVWFQERVGATARELPRPAPVRRPEPAPASAPSTPADPETVQNEDPHAETDETADEEDAPAPPPNPTSAKATSPEALDILREEAEYEARQRAREAERLESQPELGLLGAGPWPSTPEAADTAPEADKPARGTETRSDSLPDIEDISASLDPIQTARGRDKGAEAPISVPPTSAERNQSFVRGLMLPLALALVLVAAYLLAPMLGEAVPALAPITTGYVGAVDNLRLAIAGLLGL